MRDFEPICPLRPTITSGRKSEIPSPVNTLEKVLSTSFSIHEFVSACLSGSQTTPVVNRFPAPRRFKASAQNPLSCEHLATLRLARPFSVSENGALGAGCNRQGCDRTPRFLSSNSHILWLFRFA